MADTVKESIEDAVEEQEQENKSEEAPADEKKEETKSEQEPEKTSEIDDSELQAALEFYRAIRDPQQQNQIIQDLATRAGFIKPDQKLSTEEKKELGQVIDELLGEEYPDLKDKMGKILSHVQKEHQKEIATLRNELNQREAARAQESFEKEFSSFISEKKLTDAEADLMVKEIEALPPNLNGKSKITLSAYLNKIHKIVVADTKATKESTERARKRSENLSERSTNLSSDVDESRIKTGSQRPTIREAVEAASKGITFDQD